MDMKLRHHIADGGGIDLVSPGFCLQQGAKPGGKPHQRLLCHLAKIMQLAGPGNLRHQHQPEKAGIIGKPHLNSLMPGDKECACRKPFIKVEGRIGCHVSR